MRHRGRLLLLAVLLCAVALGAQNDAPDPVDRQVYPLEKQEDVWWAGIRDTCAVVGAQYQGPGSPWAPVIIERDMDEELPQELRQRLRLHLQGAIGAQGPIKITLGEDTYELKLGDVQVMRNGERIFDLLHEPKHINGVPCASLEDLGRLLGFELGEEVEGQPTISSEHATHRLVQGPPPPRALGPYIEPNHVLRGPLIAPPDIEGLPRGVVIPRRPDVRYEEHNGALYLRAGAAVIGPRKPGLRPGTLLYGPVVPGRYHAEGQSADQLFLSIVEIRREPAGVVVRPNRTPAEAPRGALPRVPQPPNGLGQVR